MWAKIIGWVTGGISPWLIVAAVAAAGAAGAYGGGKYAGYRAEAGFSSERTKLQRQIFDLSQDNAALVLSIEQQNSALAVAEAQSKASDAAKVQAEKHAADLAVFSKSRMDKLQRVVTTATTCDAVLREYWELRK